VGYRVVRDTREKKDHGWYFDATPTCEGTVRTKLDEGDYAIEGHENLMVIERKGSVSEWASNVMQKRFENELQRLLGIQKVWIVLEFTMDDLIKYPYGPTVHPSVRKKTRVTGTFLLKRTIEIERDYHNIKIVFAGTNGKQVAGSIFKRMFEMITENDKKE
jgi:hypothetical protein